MTSALTRPDRLDQILADLLAQAPDVEAAAVVSFDGLPMASALPPSLDEDRVAAMSAALLGLGERAADGLGRGVLNQIFIEGEHGTVYLSSADDEAVLVAVAARGAKTGLMLFEVRSAAVSVAEALRQHAASPAAAAPIDTFAPVTQLPLPAEPVSAMPAPGVPETRPVLSLAPQLPPEPMPSQGYEAPAADQVEPSAFTEAPSVAYAEPVYAQTAYADPAYAEPSSVEPAYAETSSVEPAYDEPAYAEPTYDNAVAESTYTEPLYAAEPAYTAPIYVAEPAAPGYADQPAPTYQAQSAVGYATESQPGYPTVAPVAATETYPADTYQPAGYVTPAVSQPIAAYSAEPSYDAPPAEAPADGAYGMPVPTVRRSDDPGYGHAQHPQEPAAEADSPFAPVAQPHWS